MLNMDYDYGIMALESHFDEIIGDLMKGYDDLQDQKMELEYSLARMKEMINDLKLELLSNIKMKRDCVMERYREFGADDDDIEDAFNIAMKCRGIPDDILQGLDYVPCNEKS